MGSPGVEVPIYEGPPSPDYVPGPEEPEQATTSPIYLYIGSGAWGFFLPPGSSYGSDEIFPAERTRGGCRRDPEEDPADYQLTEEMLMMSTSAQPSLPAVELYS
ncbi:hypothetical protein Tco_0122699 [Tanacetum coccineum]